MTIRTTQTFCNSVFTCVNHDYKNYTKDNSLKTAYNHTCRSMLLGFNYSVFHDGTYLMSIKDKYAVEEATYKEATYLSDLQVFDMSTWWYKTTMFNLDYAKSEVSDSFNRRFGEFLVWCEIVPYAR